MRNFLILVIAVFVLAVLLSHVIYALTWERWVVILLVLALLCMFGKKSRLHRR